MTQPGRLTVLVVEDEILVRLSAVDALVDRGFEVIEADHAQAAILMAEVTEQIHLLFTDVNMPGPMDGIELAEHLLGARPALKIIITSALPLKRQVSHLNAHFLAKPYVLMDLCEAAHTLMAA